jgi:two-component system phosphate regulon sensor histidine kinase PhoR
MRKRRKLLWQLYPSYLIIIVVALTTMALYTSRTLKVAGQERAVESLKVQADIVEQHGGPTLSGSCSRNRCPPERPRTKISTRITVVMPSGLVLGDSEEDPARMDNHAVRFEVKEALAGKTGIATRYSYTVNANMVYVAVPAMIDGRLAGVVRTAMPVSAMRATLLTIYEKFCRGIVMYCGSRHRLLASRKISLPITELKRAPSDLPTRSSL